MVNRIGRRNAIGLAALVGVWVTYYLLMRGDPSVARRAPDGTTPAFDAFDGPGVDGPPASRPAPPTLPPLLPPVTFANGAVASVVGIDAVPYYGPTFGMARLPSTLSATLPTTRRGPDPALQTVTVRLAITDPEPEADRDHLVRIAGQRTGGFRLDLLSGDRMPAKLVAAAIPRSARRATVEVGVASGPFVEVDRITPGDAAPRAASPGVGDDAPMRIESLVDADAFAKTSGFRGGPAGRPRTLVKLADHRRDKGRATPDGSWLLQAVRHDGTRVVASQLILTPATGLVVTINVDPKDVAYVVYRHRAYEWRSLGEIDVPPMRTPSTGPGHRRGEPTTLPVMPEAPADDASIQIRHAGP